MCLNTIVLSHCLKSEHHIQSSRLDNNGEVSTSNELNIVLDLMPNHKKSNVYVAFKGVGIMSMSQ